MICHQLLMPTGQIGRLATIHLYVELVLLIFFILFFLIKAGTAFMIMDRKLGENLVGETTRT